jgi:hypothetical protein
MTTSIGSANIGSAKPAPFSAAARQAREAKRRHHVIRFVMLAAAARMTVDKRTVVGVIVLALGVAAAASLGNERGAPGLDWYMTHAGGKKRHSA